MDYIIQSLKFSALCMAIACINSQVFALADLEQLDDYELADATGEGIAFLPTEAFMVFRGAGANEVDPLASRANDTGYIRYIPVGPLTPESAASGAGKADIFLYGLALSKSDNDTNTRIADNVSDASIKSWGTPTNPWLLKVDTATNVPDFYVQGANGGTTNDSVTYLALEAPLYEYTYSSTGVPTQLTAPSAIGEDAYKLKFAMWSDIFERNPGVAEYTTASPSDSVNDRDSGLTGRIRLQAIWNNFSINGSNIQIFQTLGGVGANGDLGINQGMSRFYNNTLGLAGLIRLNSGDGANIKAQVNANNWIAPTTNNILRLSTKECGTGNPTCNIPAAQHNLYTPAVNGGGAPNFDPSEGLFIYNPNINLVLGSLYQPLTIGSDGTNFNLEIARIPNKQDIYTKIYTRYQGDTRDPGVTYYGSTCNVYQCGSNVTLGGVSYQGGGSLTDYSSSGLSGKTLATHSSIGIGTVYSTDGGRTLMASKGADAVGISFGGLGSVTPSATGPTNNFGSALIDGLLIQHFKITTKGL